PLYSARLVDPEGGQLEAREEAALARPRVEADRARAGPDVGRILGRVGGELGREQLRRGVAEDHELAAVAAEEMVVAAPEERARRLHLRRVEEAVVAVRQARVHVD